ncbi:MAG TPA: NAD(P)H-dependent glycerol-3-phosphate dehydrogenase [Sphingomicrobium sp.]|jgi:glycerol-3-phosphate dehydrogenase (NAD(P)+)|nr:NAD(P)H-dependent glycerol-3-phosphate dehydrogenase [Sphingomicrobium sp.]
MKLGIIGAGAWGTALAQVASADHVETLVWALEAEVVRSINERRENPAFLSGIRLNESIRATGDLSEVGDCDALLIVTPVQHMRGVLEQTPVADKPLILCAKGIEEQSARLLHQVALEVCPRAPIAVLSGPTFAHEVAAGLPTAVTLATQDFELAERLRDRISRPTFRIYISDDVAGAEIGGAVKNVLAIACGVVEGRRLGQNARAALIARGFAEMRRFGMVFGAKLETLSGLAGLGDLFLTCSSTSSRNYSLGIGIGQGRPAAELLSNRTTVAEGAFTAPVLARLAREKGVDMPIVEAVDALVEGRASVDEVLDGLLSRPPRAEGV